MTKGHFKISMVKSAIRIIACIFLIFKNEPAVFAVLFGAAEILGVFEELVEEKKD